MYAVVSQLDDQHQQLTKNLWTELEKKFGLQGAYTKSFPHFSYHVAQEYDLGLLEPLIQRTAQNTKEFEVSTSGLGVFTGSMPVLYIPIVRTQELSQVHQALWHEVSKMGSGIIDYYHPERWLPHITLAFSDTHREYFPAVIQLLSEQTFSWKITVNNLSLLESTGQEPKKHFQYNFRY
ncbi:MAG: 2'-5' RNA ligase family protein [Gloeobacterales cyanobacterium]